MDAKEDWQGMTQKFGFQISNLLFVCLFAVAVS
jgi:hypothetical protein